jgi:hypothetical protein
MTKPVLASIEFWNPEKPYGANAPKDKGNPMQVPIEQKRAYGGWRIHVR